MLEMLVLLRINREFMEYVTAKFQKLKENDTLFKALEKNGSVVREESEKETETEQACELVPASLLRSLGCTIVGHSQVIARS